MWLKIITFFPCESYFTLNCKVHLILYKNRHSTLIRKCESKALKLYPEILPVQYELKGNENADAPFYFHSVYMECQTNKLSEDVEDFSKDMVSFEQCMKFIVQIW